MSVRACAAAPEGIRLTYSRPNGATYDMQTISAASIKVTSPRGRVATWTPEIVSATESQIVLRHVFNINRGDVPTVGTYGLVASFVFPDGTRRALRIPLPVEAL